MLDSMNDLNEPEDDELADLDSSAFLEELEEEFAAPKASEHKDDVFDYGQDPVEEQLVLGMNAMQRFLLSLLLFASVCLLSFFFLLVTGKIYPPFLF